MINAEGFLLPPSNLQAEQSVLGALLMDNGAIDRIGELEEAAFYSLAHQLIYHAIRKQSAAGKVWDSITVAEMLDSQKKLDVVGGLAYIGSIVQNTPSAANVANYAAIVRDNYIRRRIMATANDLNDIVAVKGDVAIAMDRVQARLLEITEGVQSDEPRSISDVLHEHYNTLESRLSVERKGIPTGLTYLDRILNSGWQRGQSVVIAGRPGHGKSALSLHHALAAARAGYGVLYLSMEMVSGELADRALAQVGKIYLGSLLTGKLSHEQWAHITAASVILHDLPLHIMDKAGLNYFQVATIARRHKRKRGLDLLVIDYLQLMAGEAGDKRHSQIEEITRGLKALAKELNCAIVLLSQLSRKTDNARRPKLSDLRDSSSVEQDADVVIFIHREECDDPETHWKNYADLYVAKNRQGALDRIGAVYEGSQVRFDDFNGALPDYSPKVEIKSKGYGYAAAKDG